MKTGMGMETGSIVGEDSTSKEEGVRDREAKIPSTVEAGEEDMRIDDRRSLDAEGEGKRLITCRNTGFVLILFLMKNNDGTANSWAC